MCGIAGFWQTGGERKGMLTARVNAMAAALAHRGPDDGGAWVSADLGLALGFRRLAILDLSPGGHQPMHSRSGRYVITFNGEVYNFRELRKELEACGAEFRSGSDTEVILAAIESWGLRLAVQRFVGMFAIALWDRRDSRISLVRDRLGIKPLYYGWAGRTFLWGSELKALTTHPAFGGEIDRGALSLYLRHNYVPAPYSIYKGIHKLLPGSILALDLSNRESGDPQPERYWSIQTVMERGARTPFDGSAEEAVNALEEQLRDAIRLRMIADVPLGAFLSGGVDSSTIVALMQSQSARPVKTFSVGFREKSYDEAPHAREVASHLGTEHHELYVTPGEARDVIPQLPQIYDEPFSDSSQIPTFLVSQLARRHVTVSLSGDGGDELFAGYRRYFTANAIWSRMGRVPLPARRMAGSLAALVPGHRGRVWAEFLGMRTPQALYHRMISHWKSPASLVIGGHEPPTAVTGLAEQGNGSEFTRHMMLADLVGYLPDDILTKVDRASMAVSLEARVPLLDHRVVEFAAALPTCLKVREGESKWVLRRVLDKYVPRKLIDRPKMGFGVPIDAWLRGPLREWAEDLISERRLRHDGFFDPGPIRAKWTEHLAGKHDWQYYLWDILMFQAWLSAGCKSAASSNLPAAATL